MGYWGLEGAAAEGGSVIAWRPGRERVIGLKIFVWM